MLDHQASALFNPPSDEEDSSDDEVDIDMDTNARIVAHISRARASSPDVETWQNALARLYVSVPLEDNQALMVGDVILGIQPFCYGYVLLLFF